MSKKPRDAKRPRPQPVIREGEAPAEPRRSPEPQTSQRAAPVGSPSHIGLGFTLMAALVYCLWLGAHWLPLDYTDRELAGSAARVWDIKRELVEHGTLAWWTPNYMSGSSYGLNHARGFYLVPWILLSSFTDLLTAGKLMALVAIFAGAVAMYCCARHFLARSASPLPVHGERVRVRGGSPLTEWAATLSALAYMLHPEQIIRAATQEHMTIILFMPFIPLLWLTFTRALETQRLRDALWCALVVVLAMWTDNKQVFIQGVFLFCYLVYWVFVVGRLCKSASFPAASQKRPIVALRTLALIGVASLALGAFVIVPGLVEQKLVKLFEGDPIMEWQHAYSFKSLFGLVDRDGTLTRGAMQAVQERLQAKAYQPRSQAEADDLRANIQRLFSMNSDSPEKYAGLFLLAAIAVTALFNRQRVNRRLFWFFAAMLLLTVMLASGYSTVIGANLSSAGAVLGLDGVPLGLRLGVLLLLAVSVACLIQFARSKLTTPRKWIIAGVALAVFLIVPGFRIVALIPLFKEVRAPYVFYDLPAVFVGAMLAGLFVTDVLDTERWRAHIPKIVGALGLLMFVDYWPYEKSVKENPIEARTLQNLRATYGALRQDADWVKVYAVSGRYFHQLGPMLSGKPQVWESFYNWMSPVGTGALNQQAHSSLEAHRTYLNLLGARYIVFDKSDPASQGAGSQQMLAAYGKMFSVAQSNDDFIVFRNDTAHLYVTAYAGACTYAGDVRKSPQLALALAAKNFPLVHDAHLVATVKEYTDNSSPFPPAGAGKLVTLSDVTLTRENNGLVRLTLTAPQDCVVVIAESYYPFWRAKVDGKHADVLRVSCALMGLQLSAGKHDIVLSYQPPGAYTTAGVVSVAALLCCVGLMIWDWRRA